MGLSRGLVCRLHQKLLKHATKDGLANLQWSAVGQCEAQQSSNFTFKWLESGLSSKRPLLLYIIYHTVDFSCYPKHLPFTNNRICFPGIGEEEERGDAIFLPMVVSQKM